MGPTSYLTTSQAVIIVVSDGFQILECLLASLVTRRLFDMWPHPAISGLGEIEQWVKLDVDIRTAKATVGAKFVIMTLAQKNLELVRKAILDHGDGHEDVQSLVMHEEQCETDLEYSQHAYETALTICRRYTRTKDDNIREARAEVRRNVHLAKAHKYQWSCIDVENVRSFLAKRQLPTPRHPDELVDICVRSFPEGPIPWLFELHLGSQPIQLDTHVRIGA